MSYHNAPLEQRDFVCPISGAQCEDPRCNEEDCWQEGDKLSPEERARQRAEWAEFVKRLGVS